MPTLSTHPTFDTAPLRKDYTPNGLKYEGPYENDRNTCFAELYKDIIREAYGAKEVICAHHLVFVQTEVRDGSPYTIVEEVPSADTLIFDHDVARKIFGPTFRVQLAVLACHPIETRDAKLAELYYGRPTNGQ